MLRMVIALQEKVRAFKADDSGATAIEYGLIAAGIALAIIAAVGTLGDDVTSTFSGVSSGLSSQ